MIESKKPLVGHNSIFDALHLFHKFVRQLPKTLSDFKTSFHEAFPLYIYLFIYLFIYFNCILNSLILFHGNKKLIDILIIQFRYYDTKFLSEVI